MLSSLLAAQDELGYLPDEAIEEVATFTESTINEVWGVASFYTNFRFTPPGEHVVEVCWGPTWSSGGRPLRPAGPARFTPPGGRGRDGGRAGNTQVQHLPRRLLTGARYQRRPQARGETVPAVGRRARPAGRRAGRLSGHAPSLHQARGHSPAHLTRGRTAGGAHRHCRRSCDLQAGLRQPSRCARSQRVRRPAVAGLESGMATFQELKARADREWRELVSGQRPWIRVGTAMCGPRRRRVRRQGGDTGRASDAGSRRACRRGGAASAFASPSPWSTSPGPEVPDSSSGTLLPTGSGLSWTPVSGATGSPTARWAISAIRPLAECRTWARCPA